MLIVQLTLNFQKLTTHQADNLFANYTIVTTDDSSKLSLLSFKKLSLKTQLVRKPVKMSVRGRRTLYILKFSSYSLFQDINSVEEARGLGLLNNPSPSLLLNLAFSFDREIHLGQVLFQLHVQPISIIFISTRQQQP